VSLEINGVQGVYVIPDLVDLVSLLGPTFTDLITIDWQRLAGAKVISIEGQDPYAYIDFIAKTVSGFALFIFNFSLTDHLSNQKLSRSWGQGKQRGVFL
jgi:hypothetical protein